MPIEEFKQQNQQSNSFNTDFGGNQDSSLLSSSYPFDKPLNLHNNNFSNTGNLTDSAMSSMPTTDQSWVHSSIAQPEHSPLEVPSSLVPATTTINNGTKIEQSDKPYPHREAHSATQHYLTPDTSAQVLASVVDPNLGTPVSTTGLGPHPYPVGVNSGQTEPAWLHPVQDDKDFEKESTEKPSHMSKLLHFGHHDKHEGKEEQFQSQDMDEDKEKHKHKKHEKHHKKHDDSDEKKSNGSEQKEGLGKKIGNWVSNTLDDVKASVGGIAHVTEKPSDPDRVHEETYSVDKAPEGQEPNEQEGKAHLGLPLQRGKFD